MASPSMETLLTFEPKVFVKFTKILTSPRENIFVNASYFIQSPLMGRVISWIKSLRF